MNATLKKERRLWSKGYKTVAGLDEAGRGPLAGPVVACVATVLPLRQKHSHILENMRMFFGIKDSKKLSAKQREEYYSLLASHPQIQWGIGVVSEKVIDRINILQATKLAMSKAMKNFQRRNKRQPDYLLIDGNFAIKTKISQQSIIRGDQTVFSIAAAGIIAKVTRDGLMRRYHKKYPQYAFHQHKGYGTRLHFQNIRKFGACDIHRKTFRMPFVALAKNEIV